MAYLQRLVEPMLAALLTEVPAALLTGTRASGKTTTARRFASSVVQLDDPSVGGIFRQAPDVALRGLAEPVLLDEWQDAPEVIGAIKRTIDHDPRPGRFVLTGSAAIDLAGPTWPGTGRIIRVPMGGLTEREIASHASARGFIDVLLEEPEKLLNLSTELDVADYVDLALRSGFPEPALRLGVATRAEWLASYREECFARDVPALRPVRGLARLRRLFAAFAINTAGVVEEKTLHDAARLDRRTAVIYESLFEATGLTEQVPAYAANRLKRLTERPKRYVVDCGLVGSALAVDRAAVLRDGNLLGRLVDTFVFGQLRSELAASPSPARHLRWLKGELGELGEQVAAAVVFHTGARAYALGDGVLAVPIAALWNAST